MHTLKTCIVVEYGKITLKFPQQVFHHLILYATHDTRLTHSHRKLRLVEDFEMLCLMPDFETLCLTYDFKTLHLMPASHQPDVAFQNQASGARFLKSCIRRYIL